EEARRLRGLARKDVDILAERRTSRAMLTFEEAARKVHEQHGAAFKNEKHRAQWLRSLEADVFPVFGDRRVDDVDSADVLRALQSIWTTKPETARRLRQRIRLVLDWARASKLRTGDNPVDGLRTVLPRQASANKHHAAIPYQQVPAFLGALQSLEASESTRLA